MEAYLNRSIKEVIKEFPPVEKILDDYGIGCGPCAVGLCLLKDIVSIHNLPADDEQEMMARVAQVIFPGREVRVPQAKKKTEPKPKEISYSPPLKRLVDEHVLIKKWLALIPEVTRGFNVDSEEDRQLIREGVDLIRSYADKFHHAKEEDILFKYFDENLDIIKTMLEDHEKARGHVRALVGALEKRDKQGIVEPLNAYRELLTEHIKKEDEILYPWMDRNFSVKQVGELYSKFNEVSGDGVTERSNKFVTELEEKMQKTKKEVIK